MRAHTGTLYIDDGLMLAGVVMILLNDVITGIALIGLGAGLHLMLG
ncbi:MAG: hypothetical protein ABH803_00465 [Candidatus Micrarchaeota archaeon]